MARKAGVAAAYVFLWWNLPNVTTADIKKLKINEITTFWLYQKKLFKQRQSLLQKHNGPHQLCDCYGFFGLCDTDRINTICIKLPKVSKVSTAVVAVAYVFLWWNLPNVNTADIKKLKMNEITTFFTFLNVWSINHEREIGTTRENLPKGKKARYSWPPHQVSSFCLKC